MHRNSPLLLILAALLAACAGGSANRADPAISQAAGTEGLSATEIIERSASLFEEGRAQDSLAFLNDGAGRLPDDRGLRLALAERQISLGMDTEAEALLTAMVEEDPRDPAPRRPLARLLRAQRRTYEAEGQYESLIQLDAGALDARAELGRMLESEQADPAMIYAHYHHVSATAGPDAPGWGLAAAWVANHQARWGIHEGFGSFEKGLSAYLRGNAEEAIADLAAAVAAMPAHAPSHYYMGLAQLRADQYKEAEQSFREAARLTPRDGRAWYQLGWVYKITSHPDKARRAWEEAARRLPADRRIQPLISSLDAG